MLVEIKKDEFNALTSIIKTYFNKEIIDGRVNLTESEIKSLKGHAEVLVPNSYLKIEEEEVWIPTKFSHNFHEKLIRQNSK